MRSLGRVRRARSTASAGAEAFHGDELRTIRRRERAGLLRAGALAVFLLGVAATLAWSAHGRIVADGLVEANLVELCAPDRVRVVEVHCAPGRAFRRGDVLFVLEAIDQEGERRALELAVERAALRLHLARAGGDLGLSHLDGRLEAADEAEREWRLAEAALEVALERELVLRARQATLSADTARKVQGHLGEAVVQDQRAGEARAWAEHAEAERGLFELDLQSRRALSDLGGVSERETRSAEVALAQGEKEVEAHRLRARSFASEAESLRQAGVFEEALAGTVQCELEAELGAAAAESGALRVRRDLWRATTLRRRVLCSGGPEEIDLLRRLELELLEGEVEAAEQALAAFDRRVGNATLRAESDGVCDQLLVQAGVVAAGGELLATHYDPRTRRVMAYLGPGAAERIALGQVCSVAALESDASLWGRIASSAAAWIPRPVAIPGREEPSSDRRLPFRLAVSPLPESYRPGLRVAVVFERSAEAPPAADRAGAGR